MLRVKVLRRRSKGARRRSWEELKEDIKSAGEDEERREQETV